MKNTRIDDVLSSCPNYDAIINYNVKDSDEITRKLINYYEDYVFINISDKNKINKLDLMLYHYISNREFYNYIQERFKNEGDVLPIFEELEKIFNNFKKDELKNVENAVWI